MVLPILVLLCHLLKWTQLMTVRCCFVRRLAHCAALTTLPSPNSGPDWLVLAVGMDRNISLMLAAPGTTFQASTFDLPM